MSGALVNIPPHSDAGAFHVVGAHNELSAPTLRQVTVHFPTKGTDPLEIDYTEAHVGDLSFTLGTTDATPIPSTYDGFPPGDWFGNQPDGGYASEPVNTATGNYTREADDLTFPATVKGLNFIRTYNSMDPRGGPLGLGWTANAYATIDASGSDAVTRYSYDSDGRLLSRTDGDGDTTSYTYNAAGQQASLRARPGRLQRVAQTGIGCVWSSTPTSSRCRCATWRHATLAPW